MTRDQTGNTSRGHPRHIPNVSLSACYVQRTGEKIDFHKLFTQKIRFGICHMIHVCMQINGILKVHISDAI